MRDYSIERKTQRMAEAIMLGQLIDYEFGHLCKALGVDKTHALQAPLETIMLASLPEAGTA